MATLVFSSVGTALGGPVGGAVGALMGRQVDTGLFGSAKRSAGKLSDLSATDSTYGQVLPRHFGTMRTGGAIIWATDLVEHTAIEGGTKGASAVTVYSYTANFAVALASRPISGVGRIWADGTLLRGAQGDLKVAGELRIHTGAGDQTPDPLIAANEGDAYTSAHRDLAYVVFENLDLSAYYNRIPTLTFEVIAGSQVSLQDLVGEVVETASIDVTIDGLLGFSHTDTVSDSLAAIDQVIPLATHVEGEALVIERRDAATPALVIGEATASPDEDAFGAASGWTRSRAAPPQQAATALRYYDPARDFLTCVQRSSGRAACGQPATIEMPAALAADTARALIETTARRIDWSRDRIAWRTRELDPQVRPGAFVTLPATEGRWRVSTWEWRDCGVELALERCAPTGADTAPAQQTSAGRSAVPADDAAAHTQLVAFERPDDGAGGALGSRRIQIASAGTGSSWRGAGLYFEDSTGALSPIGTSNRPGAVLGTATTILPPAHPAVFDRTSFVDVQLASTEMQLVAADTQAISNGANLALVGDELIQFVDAAALAEGRWRLRGLLRGRGGTDAGISTHALGEAFALVDSRVASFAAESTVSSVAAQGIGDPAPVSGAICLSGLSLRPPSPVHPRAWMDAQGTWTLAWTRRSRGGWRWQDGIDAPLAEEFERYIVSAGDPDNPVARWTVSEPVVTIDPALALQLSGQDLRVCQQGTFALSHTLWITRLP